MKNLPVTMLSTSQTQRAEERVSPQDILDITLETVRNHFGMEAAYLSEFVDGRAIFRAVDAPGLSGMIQSGQSMNVSDIYCQHILDGHLPRLMTDTHNHQLAMDIPITTTIPIRSHASVPVYRDDGSVYGMFCCLSRQPSPTLTNRDLKVMESFAAVAGKQVNETLRQRTAHSDATTRIDDVFEKDQVSVVLQPVFDIATGQVCSFEALSRFSGSPYRSPDLWFEEAQAVGRRVELEAHVIRKALALITQLPDHLTISINISPETVVAVGLRELHSDTNFDRVVVEVTEHAIVSDYDSLSEKLATLQASGAKIAVDDVGAGYSGLVHLLRLKPDILKLDIGLVRDIDTDTAKESLVIGIMHFAASIGTTVVAEGIETEGELNAVRRAGVHRAQGFLLGKPLPFAETEDWLRTAFPPS